MSEPDRIRPETIRNVVLVGHSGTGKTSLAEALLHEAGATTRMGSIEEGTTACDCEPEEKQHGISMSLAVASFNWKGHKVNLIDTPGYADFEYEALIAMAVADLAVFVVSAVDGVGAQHERLWRTAAEIGLPRMIFMNKLDRENADFDSSLNSLRDRFGAGVAPLELPIGEGSTFCGVADLLTDTAFLYENGIARSAPIPDELEAVERRVHDNLVEGIVVADDALLERYLTDDTPEFDELEHALAHGVVDATVFPVVCGAATARIAIDRLANFICEIGPSPLDGSLDRPLDESLAGDPTAAFVFKTFVDPYVGQVSVLKVLTGNVKAGDHLVNVNSGTPERVHGLSTLIGNDHSDVTEACRGDIAAVNKLGSTKTGDTLARDPQTGAFVGPKPPDPVYRVAVHLDDQSEADKLANALHKLTGEDPTLSVIHDDATRQTLLCGTGDTHLTIVLERLRRRFGVGISTEEVRVAYLETITGTAGAEGKFKKQSGGHGQFGVVSIEVEPLARGGGFEFVDRIVGGAIPRQFIPAVEKGVIEALEEGGPYGFPVVDVRVTLVDGRFHAVDSSEMSFKMAGRLAIREALLLASPIILEPVSLLEVTIPSVLLGDIMGDLNSRRGRIGGTEMTNHDEQTVTAIVPTSEVLDYAIDLRSRTSGTGSFTMRHDHYDVLPQHLADTATQRQAT